MAEEYPQLNKGMHPLALIAVYSPFVVIFPRCKKLSKISLLNTQISYLKPTPPHPP
jgi:hypothetical protein